MSDFFRTNVTTEDRRLSDGRGVQPEEFRKQAPCRFGLSAAGAGCITVLEPGEREGGTCWEIATVLLTLGRSGPG